MSFDVAMEQVLKAVEHHPDIVGVALAAIVVLWARVVYVMGAPYVRVIASSARPPANDGREQILSGDFSGILRPGRWRTRIWIQNQDAVPIHGLAVRLLSAGKILEVRAVGGVREWRPHISAEGNDELLLQAAKGMRGHATWVLSVETDGAPEIELSIVKRGLDRRGPPASSPPLGRTIPIRNGGIDCFLGRPTGELLLPAMVALTVGACALPVYAAWSFSTGLRPAAVSPSIMLLFLLIPALWGLLAFLFVEPSRVPAIQGYLGWGRDPAVWVRPPRPGA